MTADHANTRQDYWLRIAAVLYLLSLSWPMHWSTLQYVIRERALPTVMTPWGQPIRALSGPIEQAWGPNAIIVSILAFGVLSAFDVLAGYWLWKRQRRGSILALVLLPIYWLFAMGWAVPYMLIIGALKGMALAFGWKSAR